jgi:hypothetical protein
MEQVRLGVSLLFRSEREGRVGWGLDQRGVGSGPGRGRAGLGSVARTGGADVGWRVLRGPMAQRRGATGTERRGEGRRGFGAVSSSA